MPNWKPMTPAKSIPLHRTRRRELVRWAASQGYSEAEVEALIAGAEQAETWMNDTYVATIHTAEIRAEGWPNIKQLSIRRVDRKTIHDWRHLQRIKSDIFGPDAEAVELYPADKRVVDTANSYHLWVLEPGQMFPFGWASGLRTDTCAANIPNQQRSGASTE